VFFVSNVTDGDSYISTYHCPEPNTEGSVHVASVSGFCTPESIKDSLSSLRSVLVYSQYAWISLI